MSPVQDALVQVCGGEEMADRATQLWDDIKTKNRLDVSDQNLSDDDVKCLIKGLHMCDTCHACPGLLNAGLLSLSENVGLLVRVTGWQRRKTRPTPTSGPSRSH